MWLRSILAVCVFVLWLSSGCGNEDLIFPGMAVATAVPSTSPTPCINSGGSCVLDSDCCDGVCTGGICQ